MDGINNLIIDFGGVLISLARSRCVDAFERIGISSTREPITTGFKPKDLFTLFEHGLISPAAFRLGLRKLGDRKVSSSETSDSQIDDAWNKMLGEMPDDMPQFLMDLRKRYNTMLLSNTNILHWEWAKKNYFENKGYSIDNCFNQIYLSFELRMCKPDTEIYKYVIQHAGIRPEETLLIDDSPINCRAAEKLGIKTFTAQFRDDWRQIL